MKIYNYTLDVVRVIAMFGVILDHYLQQSCSKILINSGLWIGGGSVAVFLAISAYLYGIKWRESGCIGINVVDLLKREV